MNRLRDRAAAIECGDIKVPRSEEEGLAEIDIRTSLYELKSPTLSDAQFNELWANAIHDLENKDEVEISMSRFAASSSAHSSL